jgi:WD40 repeat protein
MAEPVEGGCSIESLPDELIVIIMLMLPITTLWSGACERVCLRWERLMETASIVRRKRDGRWEAYEAGTIKPRRLEGHTDTVYALTVGLDGNVYSGSTDTTIMVWSGEGGAHLQTVTGHTDRVYALAIGLEGNIYSGSHYGGRREEPWTQESHTVRVWSGDVLVRTLEGHTRKVVALAVGLDGKIYSGSNDHTIRVWAAEDGAHVQTLVGHARAVTALAVGKDGAVYSGSSDLTIKVWSCKDGTHIRTLAGHTDWIASIIVATDGRVYSGSGDNDSTIRVWSPVDGTHLQTLKGHTRTVLALVSSHGKVYSGSLDGTVMVWSSVNGALLHTMRGSVDKVGALALGRDGTLYSGGAASNGSFFWVDDDGDDTDEEEEEEEKEKEKKKSKVRLEMW